MSNFTFCNIFLGLLVLVLIVAFIFIILQAWNTFFVLAVTRCLGRVPTVGESFFLALILTLILILLLAWLISSIDLDSSY